MKKNLKLRACKVCKCCCLFFVCFVACSNHSFCSNSNAFLRRFIDVPLAESAVQLCQKRFMSGRYISLPKVPEWLDQKNQSHEKSKSFLTTSKNWKQHYNPVDGILYYQSSKSDLQKRIDEVYVSNNLIERVQKRGEMLVRTALPYRCTGRIETYFSLNNTEIVGLGTAVTIDRYIALSAAHNFLPQSLLGTKNISRKKSDSVNFNLRYDYKTPDSRLLKVLSYRIHPKWEQNFDSNYDFAVLLLGDSVSHKKDASYPKPYLVQNSSMMGERIFVVGYPGSFLLPGVWK
jgi:hypothetical protein